MEPETRRFSVNFLPLSCSAQLNHHHRFEETDGEKKGEKKETILGVIMSDIHQVFSFPQTLLSAFFFIWSHNELFQEQTKSISNKSDQQSWSIHCHYDGQQCVTDNNTTHKAHGTNTPNICTCTLLQLLFSMVSGNKCNIAIKVHFSRLFQLSLSLSLFSISDNVCINIDTAPGS